MPVISNNVKGIQSFEKRIKFFEYFKNAIVSSGFIFLQETHSTIHDEKKWNGEFKRKPVFSHGQGNSCRDAIGFTGKTSFEVSNKKQDKSGRILFLGVKVSDTDLLLINIYDTNMESEQLNT